MYHFLVSQKLPITEVDLYLLESPCHSGYRPPKAQKSSPRPPGTIRVENDVPSRLFCPFQQLRDCVHRITGTTEYFNKI
jgi:hypothetical protein